MGIPRLMHAYGSAAENAIKNADLKPWLERKKILITYPYVIEGGIKSTLKKNKAEVIYENFGEKIEIQIKIEVNSVDEFINKVKDLSSGSAQIIVEE